MEFNNLPFATMLGLNIPVGNEVWACLIHFAQLAEHLCTNPFTHSDLVTQELEIKSLFSEFIDLFPDVSIKPKACFLIHYPTMIKIFGPLVTTLRFESKHSYFKSSLSGNNNRKNVWLSFAKRLQYHMMYLHYNKDFLLEHNCPGGVSTIKVCIETFNGNKQVELLRALSLKSDILKKVHAVYYEGERYWSGEAVLIGISSDEYQFGLIRFAIILEYLFFCQVLKTVSYNFHYHLYKVDRILCIIKTFCSLRTWWPIN